MVEKIIVKGISASKGKIDGVARIVDCKNFVDNPSIKFDEGDILIADFTSPLLTQLIEKSGAIVTDIGGVLSHAAIISREFGIPCIVGTKDATKLIKDGQRVLVDADQGVVYEI